MASNENNSSSSSGDNHNDNTTTTNNNINCVFCCLRARLVPDPTQHTLPNLYLLHFRGNALRNRELINYGGNPNILIALPIRFYIDVIGETRSDPEAEWEEILCATYVRGTVLRPGDDHYHEESAPESSERENQIAVISHDLVEELDRMFRARVPDAEEVERYGWVQIRRQDGRWFDPHFELVWGQETGWRGERRPSGVVCDLHRDCRFWLILIGPLSNQNANQNA